MTKQAQHTPETDGLVGKLFYTDLGGIKNNGNITAEDVNAVSDLARKLESERNRLKAVNAELVKALARVSELAMQIVHEANAEGEAAPAKAGLIDEVARTALAKAQS